MAMNVNPQNGDARQVTTYPYDYQRHPQTIQSTNYVTSANGAIVTCFIKLANGVTISGVHEQYHDINASVFQTKAYNQAIERAEQLGYKLA